MGVWHDDDDTFKTPEWRGDGGLDRGYRSVDYPNFFSNDSSSHISNSSSSHNTIVIEHAAVCCFCHNYIRIL